MAGAAAATAEAGGEAPKAGGKRKKLLLIAAPVLLLLLGGAGAWFAGLLPFGHHKEEAHHAEPAPEPVFVELPEIIANLNAGPRRNSFVKLRARVEVLGDKDAKAVEAALPRLLDLFTTYLREMRPEELRGSAGTHRLREELIARGNLAAHPAKLRDVLFTEMLVQ